MKPLRSLLKLLFLAGVLATLPSCMTTLDYPDSVKGKVRYDQGIALLTSSRKAKVNVGIDRSPYDLGRPNYIGVAVFNTTGKTFNFGSENVTATSNGRKMKVWSYDEWKRHIQMVATIGLASAAISGAANSFTAAMPSTSYTTGTINTYGRSPMYGTYSGTTTTYNSQPSNAGANAGAQIANIEASKNAQINAMDSMLRTTTVRPGQVVSGEILVSMPPLPFGKVREFTLTIDVAGEKHVFPILYKK